MVNIMCAICKHENWCKSVGAYQECSCVIILYFINIHSSSDLLLIGRAKTNFRLNQTIRYYFHLNVKAPICQKPLDTQVPMYNPDSKVHGANMGPTWVLSAPDGPHVGPMNRAIRESLICITQSWACVWLLLLISLIRSERKFQE